MSGFKDRERGNEAKYALDQELEFKANARRAKLLGLWAAEQMGITGPAVDEYAKSVVMADFDEAGDEDVFRKVNTDLTARGVAVDEAHLRAKMADLLLVAREQIQSERG
jgi:hypothetical protein